MLKTVIHFAAYLFGLLALCGLGYLMLSLWSAWRWLGRRRAAEGAGARAGGASLPAAGAWPPVSILKPLRGTDRQMYESFRSHCLQDYPRYEIIFGVNDAKDEAVAEVERLRREFPGQEIRLVVCGAPMGSNGKVSNLARMLREARYDCIIVNDSDIRVERDYLRRIVAPMVEGVATGNASLPAAGALAGNASLPAAGALAGNASLPAAGALAGNASLPAAGALAGNASLPAAGAGPAAGAQVGMVTCLYRAEAGRSLASRVEAVTIATDFAGGVLCAVELEGGLHFGLGSTLAFPRASAEAIGGLEALLDYLADDHELGRMIAKAGYRVVLSEVVVETFLPDYGWSGMFEHQLRWARTVRDLRKFGYIGVLLTFGLPWAMAAAVCAGGAGWSLWLLAVVAAARFASGYLLCGPILNDRQTLRDLWLIPVRDVVGVAVWFASFGGDTIVWRGERFHLKDGRLTRA